MSRKARHKVDRRDPGAFIQVPLAVKTSASYRGLSYPAKALLWDVAFQYKGDNNGRLLTGWKIMSEECGWASKDTLNRAKAELLASGLLFETRKGARPNRSSWCAVTWWALDHTSDMDIEEHAFPRGLYRRNEAMKITSLSTESVPIKAA